MFKQTKSALLLFSSVILLVSSCNKTEGPGGTSIIRGTVNGKSFEPAKNEITEVIVCPGSQLEHGDYWIINSPDGGTFYYVWYDNPTWISDGDPHLEGRTGIQVVFNYSDSNLEIATNTATAITTIAGADFSVLAENDILTLTNIKAGNVPDANNVSASVEINIANQGEDEVHGASSPISDERVYIVYGNSETYGDQVRTGGDGDYSFSNLMKGDYSLYVVSQDTLNPSSTVKTAISVTITNNKSVVEAPDLQVIF